MIYFSGDKTTVNKEMLRSLLGHEESLSLFSDSENMHPPFNTHTDTQTDRQTDTHRRGGNHPK